MIAVGQLVRACTDGQPGLYYVIERLDYEWKYLIIAPDVDMKEREGELVKARPAGSSR